MRIVGIRRLIAEDPRYATDYRLVLTPVHTAYRFRWSWPNGAFVLKPTLLRRIHLVLACNQDDDVDDQSDGDH